MENSNYIDKHISDLLVAVEGLKQTQETAAKNIDKLTIGMEKLIPINEKINNIENRVIDLEDEQKQGFSPTVIKWLLGLLIAYAISYGTWTTNQISDFNIYKSTMDKEFNAFKIAEEKDSKLINDNLIRIENKANENTNQITYLKGINRGLK